jgi:two-component system sensor histidine kinase CreC
MKGERFLLAQAVGNLVQNALEFSPPESVVTVAVARDGTTLLVTIEDSGPGVPVFALDKVFDRFYSLPRPDTGRKSSGLGLSIVREIAALHGGEIILENRVSGGVRARLKLPVA